MVWIFVKIAIAFMFGDWCLMIVLFMLIFDLTKLGLEKECFIFYLLPFKFRLGLIMQEYSSKVVKDRKLRLVQQDV
jgi:hypothetical protein